MTSEAAFSSHFCMTGIASFTVAFHASVVDWISSLLADSQRLSAIVICFSYS
jgi:hypothetical protein